MAGWRIVKTSFIASIALSIAWFEFAAAQTCGTDVDIDKLEKNCTAVLRQDIPLSIRVRGREVILPRIPIRPSIPGLPNTCDAPLSDALAKWTQQDVCSWETLSNHHCSHQLGWIEKVPGTCSAGGPPPICVEDHWRRSPAEASRRLADEQAKVRTQREQQFPALIKQACGCWARQIDREDESGPNESTPSDTSRPDGQPSRVFGFCSGNDCPPGHRCFERYCYQNSAWKKVVSKTVDVAQGKAVDAALDKLLEDGLKALRAGPHVIGGVSNYLLPFISPMVIALNRDNYKDRLPAYDQEIKKGVDLLLELSAFSGGGPARAPNFVKVDLRKTVEELDKKFEVLNILADATLREGDIGERGCPEVFAARHRQLTKLHGRVADVARRVITVLP